MPKPRTRRPRQVTPVSLRQLIDVSGDMVDMNVSGITHDSQQVEPGDVFVALPGAATHGARFAHHAAASGAAVIVTDEAGAALVSESAGPTAPVVVTSEPRARMGELAAGIYGHPADDLLMLGVTGTNGKTTTIYLLEAGLRAAGHTTGLIGTVGAQIKDERIPGARTTPESTDVHALLGVMREEGVTACAMEVSSHAMVFGRADGIVFDVAGFTNLTQDHLDFHADLDDYFGAKAALFTPAHARRGAVCIDGDYGQRLVKQSAVPVQRVSAEGLDTDWTVTSAQAGADGTTSATVRMPDGSELDLHVPMPGAYNVANAALALAMLDTAGVPVEEAARGIGSFAGVPGRTERIEGPSGSPLGLVDYAHTPDAITNVLSALQPRGRVIVVLGAGGDRDQHKRPLMGTAAAAAADVVVVTDDNPRSEDPAAIRAAVLDGTVAEAATVHEVAGRREAIRAAVHLAGPDDLVVVLGKGHEQGQEIAGTVHPFDDREVLRAELNDAVKDGDA